jgi:cytochrome c
VAIEKPATFSSGTAAEPRNISPSCQNPSGVSVSPKLTESAKMLRLLFLVTSCHFFFAGTAFAEGDVAAGEKLFQRCNVCHLATDTAHRNGPTLHAVVGRHVASIEGFEYSDSMKAFGATGAVWDEATLGEFLKEPTLFVKGTKMSGVPPLRRDNERADLIAYLKTL